MMHGSGIEISNNCLNRERWGGFAVGVTQVLVDTESLLG
jgi:hypothetical protein